MKKYSAIVFGLLSLSMVFFAPVKAICVGIETYVMPRGGKIYLIRDAHVSCKRWILEEKKQFLAAAKAKHAFCIIEDVCSYDGDSVEISRHVEQIKQDFERGLALSNLDTIVANSSALAGLIQDCHNQTINCYNAECRYMFNAFRCGKINKDAFDLEVRKISQEISQKMRDCKSKDIVSFCNNALVDFERVFSGEEDLLDDQELRKDYLGTLLELRILLSLYTKYYVEGYKGDTFIFVGSDHISNIRSLFDQVFSLTGLGYRMEGALRHSDILNLVSRQDLGEDGQLLSPYKVDIGGFFGQEDA